MKRALQVFAVLIVLVALGAGWYVYSKQPTRQGTVTLARLLEDPAYTADLPSVGLDALIDLVATGQLLAVVGDSAVDRLGGHVVAVPVAGLPVIDVQLTWLADADDQRIVGLVDMIEQLQRRSQAAAEKTSLTAVQ